MRETKKFKTSGEKPKEIEINTYITGGEARQISDVYLEGAIMGVEADGVTPKTPEINANLVSKAQDKAIELIVVSVNGSKENILETVLNLRKEDFDEVIKSIDNIQNPSEEKKTK